MSANPPGYKVSCSRATLEQLRALGERAKQLGILDEFRAVVNTINSRLEADPLTWGDPQYHFRQLKLLMCHGIHGMLQVYYAVDETRRIVFVKEFIPLPEHPLGKVEL